MVETNRIEYKQLLYNLDMVEQLGSGIPRILRAYSKECFVFGDSFTRMIFPLNEDIESSQKGSVKSSVKGSVKILNLK